ncbi:hypothetical protein [Parasegetibacter sp. NRK P23]|uniref:hypothetical protein n=1 Tax=Parasegetibacter sp. NRK P23 TaxID=2942999 RepID=UPI00204431FE|nr:hypothetical protein [Parasegetibacter sp. NRK P23]MCM5528665.1 hypothetical protein [Parasegetibacter sp. NRK P23]
MDTDINFSALWQERPTPKADKTAVLKRIEKFRSRRMKRIVLVNLMLLATAAFIVWIWVHYQPKLISTKAGIVLIILAISLFSVVSGKMIPLYRNNDNGSNGHDFIEKMRAIKKGEQFLHTTIMNCYFVLLTVGLCLYLYEYTLRMSGTGKLITYGATLLWVGFNWFYIRPRQIRKQQKALNEVLDKIEGIEKQFSEA